MRKKISNFVQRGTEEQFQALMREMSKYLQMYQQDPKNFSFMRYTEALDNIFDGRYSWSRDEFFKEVASRLPK